MEELTLGESVHHKLKYLFEKPQLNPKHTKWVELLSEFNCDIMYIKGKENCVYDALIKMNQVMQVSTVSD